MEIDAENEIVLGNISLIYQKLQNFPESLAFIERALKIITNLVPLNTINLQIHQSSAEIKPYLVKLLGRKAQILQKIEKKEEMEPILKEILRLDPNNKEALAMESEIFERKNLEEIVKLKAEAMEFVKSEEFSKALVIYNEILKKINQKSIEGVVEHLAVLLNKCICHLKLEQYDDIINLGIRGLRLIKAMKTGLGVENKKISKEMREKIVGFEVRFLMRRSNAYLKQNQYLLILFF